MDATDYKFAIGALAAAVVFLFGIIANAWRRCESDRAKIWDYLREASQTCQLPEVPEDRRHKKP